MSRITRALKVVGLVVVAGTTLALTACDTSTDTPESAPIDEGGLEEGSGEAMPESFPPPAE